MSFISWVNFLGLWIPFGSTAVYVLFEKQMNDTFVLSFEGAIPALKVGVLLMLLNILINLATFQNGKRKYGMLDALSYVNDPYIRPSKKRAAMYPPIPKAMQSKKPVGIVLGKRGKFYVCNILTAPGAHHTMLIGESGCGKTSTVMLDTLICNSSSAVFAIDVKGELSKKGTYLNSPDVMIMNPNNKETYGYDPLYCLSENSSAQEIVEVMKDIVYSVIPIDPMESNTFWSQSARDLLLAMLVYFYKQGIRNLIDIIDSIMGDTIQATVEEIYNEAPLDSVEHKLIIRYYGMADETISGINAQMMANISIFVDDENVRYMLRDNSKKSTPQFLNREKSLYLVISESKLSVYARLLHLIVNQVISEMEKRPEDSSPVLIAIDELPRILSVGKIYKLQNALETLRSRNVTLLLVAQSLEALERAYKKADVEAMLANCSYKIIMSATSANTQSAVKRWAGKYKEYKYSHGKSGGRYNTSTTMEDKDIVEGSELISLPQEDELIIISPYGYNRVRKVPYYSDKFISPLAKKIKENNTLLLELRGEIENE